MKVLVTGATGFLGSHVVEALLAAGHTPRALVRGSSDVSRLAALGVERVEGAVHPPAGLDEAVAGVEAVIHAAGLVKARDEAAFDAVNAEGTRHLLAALAAHPPTTRFVFVSSIAAAGPPGGDGPLSAYGRSKRRGEQQALARAGRLRVAIVQPPPVYGPRDRELLPVYRAVARGLVPVIGDGSARFGMVHVRDCAAALVHLLACEHPSGALYPVDDGGCYTSESLARHVAEALGVTRLRRLRLPPVALRIAGRVVGHGSRLFGGASMLTPDKVREMLEPDWVLGHEAIARDTGWSPRIPIEVGLAETIAYCRSTGLL